LPQIRRFRRIGTGNCRRCCCQAATTGLADHLQSTVSSDRGAATLPGNTSHTKLAGIGRADMNLFR
jgi:hypothetical protein